MITRNYDRNMIDFVLTGQALASRLILPQRKSTNPNIESYRCKQTLPVALRYNSISRNDRT
jgi:hypothetical protein